LLFALALGAETLGATSADGILTAPVSQPRDGIFPHHFVD
jgi:hypothetical protein